MTKRGMQNVYQDDAGVWWYPKARKRMRCPMYVCETCNESYPGIPNKPPPKRFWCCDEHAKHVCALASCSNTFKPKSGNHQYCSDECKAADKTAFCEECGESFLVTKGSSGRFCSNECFYENKVPTGSRRLIPSTGYYDVKVPPGTPGTKRGKTERRWMPEHRYVIQEHIGRPLLPVEEVHHKNGNRGDNRLENLELWSKSHPAGQRVEDLLAWARDTISLYG